MEKDPKYTMSQLNKSKKKICHEQRKYNIIDHYSYTINTTNEEGL